MMFTSILSAAVALATVAVAAPAQDRRSFNMRAGVNYTGITIKNKSVILTNFD